MATTIPVRAVLGALVAHPERAARREFIGWEKAPPGEPADHVYGGEARSLRLVGPTGTIQGRKVSALVQVPNVASVRRAIERGELVKGEAQLDAEAKPAAPSRRAPVET